MTPEQLSLLTDEEKRVKLAIWMGLKCIGQPPKWKGHIYETEKGRIVELPDYLNDLNAIAQVEARLTDEQYNRFCSILDSRVCRPNDRSDSLYFVGNRTVSATARQRADAISLDDGLITEPRTKTALATMLTSEQYVPIELLNKPQ